MTALKTTLLITALTLALAPPTAPAQTGTVSGSLTLERAKVKYDDAKSGRFLVVSLDGPGLGGPSAPPATPLGMDQKGLVFIPHVMALELGHSVVFHNSDNDRHNVYFLHDETGETLDIGTWGPGVSVTHRFDQAGLFITLCKLHLEMAAYILVFPHSHFQVVELDADTGRATYALENVPPGEYQLTVWHKKLKQKQGPKTVTVAAGQTTVLDDVVTKKKYAK